MLGAAFSTLDCRRLSLEVTMPAGLLSPSLKQKKEAQVSELEFSHL